MFKGIREFGNANLLYTAFIGHFLNTYCTNRFGYNFNSLSAVDKAKLIIDILKKSSHGISEKQEAYINTEIKRLWENDKTTPESEEVAK